MLVRNNTTTPCCGKSNSVEMIVNHPQSLTSDIEVTTICCKCNKGVTVDVTQRYFYELVRKGMILLPTSRPEFKYSSWPVYGPVMRKVYFDRICHSIDVLFGHRMDTDFDLLDNPFISSLAWRVQGLFRARAELHYISSFDPLG